MPPKCIELGACARVCLFVYMCERSMIIYDREYCLCNIVLCIAQCALAQCLLLNRQTGVSCAIVSAPKDVMSYL